MAIDVDGKILQRYWLDAKMYNQAPTSVLIGRKGKIRYIHQGEGKSHQQCQQDYKEFPISILSKTPAVLKVNCFQYSTLEKIARIH